MNNNAPTTIQPNIAGSTAMFHANIDGIQVLAYSADAEVADTSRRIVFASHHNGHDVSFGMSVVLARSMSIALMLACDAPHRPTLDKYEDRCLEFFGHAQGGYVSRDNKPDTEGTLPSIRLAITSSGGLDDPKSVYTFTEGKARAIYAALLAATEAIIRQDAPPADADSESRVVSILSDWPGEIEAIAEADTLRARGDVLEQPHPAQSDVLQSFGNGGW